MRKSHRRAVIINCASECWRLSSGRPATASSIGSGANTRIGRFRSMGLALSDLDWKKKRIWPGERTAVITKKKIPIKWKANDYQQWDVLWSTIHLLPVSPFGRKPLASFFFFFFWEAWRCGWEGKQKYEGPRRKVEKKANCPRTPCRDPVMELTPLSCQYLLYMFSTM